MGFLYEIFNNPIAKKTLAQVEIPNWISDNLKFKQRTYQNEAFNRVIDLDLEDLEAKLKESYHLLFKMVTGSGKNLIMAGLILHLYQKGYGNCLFFVNCNIIIQKTKD